MAMGDNNSAAMIADLTAENERLRMMLSGQLDETRLVDMHLVDGELVMNLQGGPVAYIAEYMAQVMGHPGDLNNYMEVTVNHAVAGPMVLTLQRANGKTPHQLKVEAEAEVQRLKRHLNQLYGDPA